MSARMTSLDAVLRIELAQQRWEHWTLEAQRAEDRADSRRSKAWRTRDLREAARADGLAARASADVEKWTEIAARLLEREEREARRQRPARKTSAKKKAAKKGAPKRKRVAKKVPPPKPAKRYEYILKVSYEAGRKRSDKAHHVWWDVRFRKADGSRATESELEYAVRRIHVGEIPRGWEVLSIAWDRGKRSSDYETPSREADSESELLAAMGQLGATLDSRGGMAWHDHRNEYVGANYTVGEEEVE